MSGPRHGAGPVYSVNAVDVGAMGIKKGKIQGHSILLIIKHEESDGRNMVVQAPISAEMAVKLIADLEKALAVEFSKSKVIA